MYDESNPSSITGTITQPDNPDFIKPEFKTVSVTLTTSKLYVNWLMNLQTCPCYQYIIETFYLTNEGYKLIDRHFSFPEDNKYEFSYNFKGEHKITVTCNAISNETITETYFKAC